MTTQWRGTQGDSTPSDVWSAEPPPRRPSASAHSAVPKSSPPDSDVASGDGLLRKLFAWIGAGLDFVFHITGRGIATVWRLAGALDAALWHGALHAWRAVYGVLAATIGLLGDSAIDFVRWLPSRGGRAYFAGSGVVLIVSSLWIIDEVRRAESQSLGAFDAPEVAPIDLEDPILARIQGRYIHLSDVAASAFAAGLIDGESMLTPQAAFDRGLVQRHIEQRLIAQAAEEAGMMRDPSVARQVNLARDRILASAFLDARVKDASSPDLVEQLYRSQADVVRLGDEVIARQIVVASAEDAEAVLAAIADGGDFASLAKELSSDRASAGQGGKMDPFTRYTVAPALSRAAFSTTPGEFAPIFATEHGWHVLQVLDRQPSSSIGLEAVRGRIEDFLAMKAVDATLQSLRDRHDVIFYNPEAQGEIE